MSVKYVMSCSTVLRLWCDVKSDSLGVGRPIILEAVVVISVAFALFLTDNMLKKQVEPVFCLFVNPLDL